LGAERIRPGERHLCDGNAGGRGRGEQVNPHPPPEPMVDPVALKLPGSPPGLDSTEGNPLDVTLAKWVSDFASTMVTNCPAALAPTGSSRANHVTAVMTIATRQKVGVRRSEYDMPIAASFAWTPVSFSPCMFTVEGAAGSLLSLATPKTRYRSVDSLREVPPVDCHAPRPRRQRGWRSVASLVCATPILTDPGWKSVVATELPAPQFETSLTTTPGWYRRGASSDRLVLESNRRAVERQVGRRRTPIRRPLGRIMNA
jgi:hypothetical protein